MTLMMMTGKLHNPLSQENVTNPPLGPAGTPLSAGQLLLSKLPTVMGILATVLLML